MNLPPIFKRACLYVSPFPKHELLPPAQAVLVRCVFNLYRLAVCPSPSSEVLAVGLMHLYFAKTFSNVRIKNKIKYVGEGGVNRSKYCTKFNWPV